MDIVAYTSIWLTNAVFKLFVAANWSYKHLEGTSWPWSYGSWIYNYLCNQGLSPLMLWVRISISARCTTLCDKVCQWLATGRCFSPGPPVFYTNKTDSLDITEILLLVALNIIKPKQTKPNILMRALLLIHLLLYFFFLLWWCSQPSKFFLIIKCLRKQNLKPLTT